MHDKKISTSNPALINLILDDSGSMGENLPGTSDPKFRWVERLAGIILKDLLTRSTDIKGDTPVIKPRYWVHTILYGSNPHLWGTAEMDIQAVIEKYSQAGNSFGLGGQLGGTDAQAAYQMSLDYLRQAVTQERFKHSFPPLLFHLTDAMSHTDASAVAEQIKQLATEDGNVLLVNAYIGTQTNLSYRGPEDFPGYLTLADVGPSSDNVRMFNMSSEAPETIRQNLVNDGIFPNFRKGARLFFDVRTKEMLKHVIQVVGSIGSRNDRMAQ